MRPCATCSSIAACDAWLQLACRLAQAVADAERQAAMLAANPKYVLRNWLAEVAIRQARAGDFSEVQRLLSCLRQTLRRTAGIRGLCSLAAGLGERPGSQLLQLMAAG
jgi:uncharacterized protein YdiU (UPF0061 family)